jgi:putative addiction module component (TIGR02574 family)
MNAASIFAEVMKLPPAGRIQLIDFLYGSLEEAVPEEVQAAQLAEIKDHWAAYERGEMGSVEWDAAVAELKAKYLPAHV